MADDRQLRKKIEELFTESDAVNANAINTERSELLGLTEDDVREVAQVLKHNIDKKEKLKAKQPKIRWKWNFYGLQLAKLLWYLSKLSVVGGCIFFLLPIAINTNVSAGQAISIVTLLAVLKSWMKN